MHLFLLVKPNNLSKLKHLIDSLNLIPVNVFPQKVSRVMLQLVIEVANWKHGELFLRFRQFFIKTVALTARADKHYVLASLKPKLMLQCLLFIFLLNLSLWRLLFFLGWLLWVMFHLFVLDYINLFKVMLLFHKVDHTILTIKVQTWVCLVYQIHTGNCFACIQDVFHAAVTLPFLEAQLECMEISVESPVRLLNVFQDLGGYCDSINGVAKLHQTYHKEVFLMHSFEIISVKELVDDRNWGALCLQGDWRRDEVLELTEPDKECSYPVVEIELLNIAREAASLLLNVLIVKYDNVHHWVKRLLINLEEVLLVKFKVQSWHSNGKKG